MDQARLENYAGWLVQNKDKQGSPEFDTVANAYKSLRSGDSSDAPTPDKYNLSDVPAAALKNAPADAMDVAKGFGNAVVADIPKTLPAVGNKLMEAFDPLTMAKHTGGQVVDMAKSMYDKYNSWDKTKTQMAEHPVATALDAAQVLPLIPKGVGAAADVAGSVASKARALNKIDVPYPEVAPTVGNELKSLHDTGEHDLTNLADAKAAVSKLYTDNAVQSKIHRGTLDDLLNPTNGTTPEDIALRTEAAKAFRSSDHQVMDHPTASQIDAVDQLVGDTQQGAELVHGLKKHVVIQDLRKNLQGGVSQYTDRLNPFQLGQGSFGLKGLPGLFLAGAQYAHPLGPLGAVAQGGLVVGGKVADLALGMPNGSRAFKFAKQYGKDVPPDVGAGLPDVIAQRRMAETALARQAQDAADLKASQAAAADESKQNIASMKMHDSADTMNKAFDTNKANQAAKAQAAIDKLNAPPKEGPAPKTDLGINAVALKMAHQKARATTAAMQKAIEGGAKAETKAAEKAAKPQAAPKAPKNSLNNPVDNQARYDEGVARIKGQEAVVTDAIANAKDPVLKNLLADGYDMFHNEFKGGKNHFNRLKHFDKLMAQAETKHQRHVLMTKLHPLANTFRHHHPGKK